MTPIDKPRVGKVIGKSVTSPINLGVGAAAATLAIGLGSLPLAALGLLAYGALVAYDTFNPTFWKKVYALPARAQLELPEPKAVKDPGTRDALVQILATKAELERVLDDTSPEVQASLSTTLSSLAELDTQATKLIQRAEVIAKHLGTVNEDALRADAVLLQRRAAATKDARARQSFVDAKAARDDELRTLDELRSAKDRIDAQLLRVVAVLGGLPTKVVHMRALDSDAADKFSGDVNAELEAISSELETSEEVMKSLGEVVR